MRTSTRMISVTAGVVAVIGALIAAPAQASTAVSSKPEATSVATVTTTKAAAAATPSFEIFYAPGCKSASRKYSGVNRGEAWINDTFNSTAHGSAGYGQKIRNNAASVVTHNAQSVNIKGNDGVYIAFSGSTCQTLEFPYGNRRNNNIGWQLVPLGGF